MDKVHSHMDKLNKAASRSQGGGNLNSGPNSAKNIKTGDSVSSQFRAQDNSREQGGPPKNDFKEV